MNDPYNPQRIGSQANDDCDDVMLSDTGRSRRNSILMDLQGIVASEGRRRRLRRRIVRSVSLAVIIFGASISLWTQWPTSYKLDAITINANPNSYMQIQIVEANTDAVAAMIVSPEVNITDYYIDDRGLIDLLADIGRPSGLVRKQDAVCLAVPVTDPISP